ASVIRCTRTGSGSGCDGEALWPAPETSASVVPRVSVKALTSPRRVPSVQSATQSERPSTERASARERWPSGRAAPPGSGPCPAGGGEAGSNENSVLQSAQPASIASPSGAGTSWLIVPGSDEAS